MRILNFHGPANNLSRSRRLHMLFFLGVPENFTKLAGKQLCRSLGARAHSLQLYLKRGCHEYFSVNLAEFLRTTFLKDISELELPVIFLSGKWWEVVVNSWQKKYFLRNVISLKWNDEWLRTPILKMNQPLSMSFWINKDTKLHNTVQTIHFWVTEPWK